MRNSIALIFLALSSIASFALAMDVKEAAQSPAHTVATPRPMVIYLRPAANFQELPNEALQEILIKTVHAPTLDQAIKNFAQSTATSRQTLAFRHDERFNAMVIQALQKRFPTENLEDIVVKMNTKEALDWYFKKFPEALTDNDRLKKLFEKARHFKRSQALIELNSANPLLLQIFEGDVIEMDSPALFNWYLAKHPATPEKLIRLLAHAVDKNSPKIIEKIVVANHIPVNSTMAFETPLEWAISNAAIEATNKLLELGANPNVRQKNTLFTPLHIIVSKPDYPKEAVASIIQLLLESGANVNAQNKEGKSVLDIANEKTADNAIIQMLRDAGALTSAEIAAGPIIAPAA